jgi:hypothetical protein
VHPTTGAIWSVENGPNGGDEVNELKTGKNYGWPVIGKGRFYLGPRVSVDPYREDMEPPMVYWVPAIAPSGLLFYTGDKLPQWKNHLFVGGMRQGEVPRSGHLERVDFNDKWEELHREGMLRELQQRIRDVRQSPDGYLYLLTAENDGALLKIEAGTPAANEPGLARRAPARAPRPPGPPGDARVSRRDVGPPDRRGGLRAGLHERVRGVGRAARDARHRADLVRRAGRPGAEHLPRRLDSRSSATATPASAARRTSSEPSPATRAPALPPSCSRTRWRRSAAGTPKASRGGARRGADAHPRRRGRAERGRRHPHHGAHRRRAVSSLDEAIARCQAFRALGADITFLEAPLGVEEMRRYCQEVDGPKMANLIEGGKTPLLPHAELEAIGYKIAVYPLTI